MRSAKPVATLILQITAALLFLLCSYAHAGSATLAWDANTEPDLGGYRLYYGTASGVYGETLDVGKVTTATVQNLTEGATYYFVVTAYNTAALESVPSAEITYTVPLAPNTPPAVAITSPANGASFGAPANLMLGASATDQDGSIVRVEFYQGATKLGESVTAPYSFAWNGVGPGTYQITAAATDNRGGRTVSAAVSITVSLPNLPPSVLITSPVVNTTFNAPANITVNADALDADGTVARVEFFSGSSKLGEDVSSPFSFTWSNVSAGNYTLTAIAVDDDGAQTTSLPVSISVLAPNQAPTVAITSPVNGASFGAPANLTLAASASDQDGSVVRVEFYQGATKLGESVTAPYSIAWNAVGPGSYQITAAAIDNRAARTVSVAVSITVEPPNQPPSVLITSPPVNATFNAPANISISADALDADGTVARVEFYDGSSKLGEDVSGPFSFSWSNVSAGSYTLTAVAVDDDGAQTTSLPVTISVLAPNQTPTVAIISPSKGAGFSIGESIPITASAADSDGSIARVEFFSGTTIVGTCTSSPYRCTWTGAAIGSHTLTAVAFDNRGASTTSAPVQITVNAPSDLVLTTNGTAFDPGAEIVLTTSTAQLSGRIRRVEFLLGSTLLYRDGKSPYSYAWWTATIGTHQLVARAIMQDNRVLVSAPVTITVGATVQGSGGTAEANTGSPNLPAVSPQRIDDGTVDLTISGQPGQALEVWVSSDLTTWSLMTSLENYSGEVVVSDLGARDLPQRFYRVSVK